MQGSSESERFSAAKQFNSHFFRTSHIKVAGFQCNSKSCNFSSLVATFLSTKVRQRYTKICGVFAVVLLYLIQGKLPQRHNENTTGFCPVFVPLTSRCDLRQAAADCRLNPIIIRILLLRCMQMKTSACRYKHLYADATIFGEKQTVIGKSERFSKEPKKAMPLSACIFCYGFATLLLRWVSERRWLLLWCCLCWKRSVCPFCETKQLATCCPLSGLCS